MHDLISVCSCNMGKISLCNKIVIEDQKRKGKNLIMFYMNFYVKDGLGINHGLMRQTGRKRKHWHH